MVEKKNSSASTKDDSISYMHLQLPSSNQSFGITVDPVVYLSVLDHYTRRNEKDSRVIGALLGVRSEDGAEVEVRNCFPLHYSEEEDEQIVFDADYLNQMYSLHQKVNAKEVIVGWYATGAQMDANSVWIHDYFANETAPYRPVHLLVDTTLENNKMSIKAFVNSPMGVPDTEQPGSMFFPIPCEVKYLDTERAGLDIISQGKSSPSRSASLVSDMDNLERSILKVQDMLDIVSKHVESVVAGKTKGNGALGRFLIDTVSSIPRMDPLEFEKMFNNHLQDLLMVVYLANLTRTQLALAERLQNIV